MASDDFNRANGGLGANWVDQQVQVGGALTISSNEVTADNTLNCQSFWDADSFNANQFSQATIKNNANHCGLIVRASGTGASCNSYSWLAQIGSLFKLVNGTYTSIQSGLTGSALNDVMRLEVNGTTLKAFLNGVQANTDLTNSVHATGKPGLYGHTNTTRVDTWSGGDLGGGATVFTKIAAERFGLAGGRGLVG